MKNKIPCTIYRRHDANSAYLKQLRKCFLIEIKLSFVVLNFAVFY